MSAGLVLMLVLLVGVAGFLAGRQKSLALINKQGFKLHSLPGYHGQAVSFLAVVPALAILLVWMLAQPFLLDARSLQGIEHVKVSDAATRSLVLSDIRRVAEGLELLGRSGALTEDGIAALDAGSDDIKSLLADQGIALGSSVNNDILTAAKGLRADAAAGRVIMTIVVLVIALAGGAVAYRRIEPDFRARNVAERAAMGLLILSATVAVATTVGIILSLFFETLHFFNLYAFEDFFFSVTWNPQFNGGSDLGIIPLLWGTLYVSFVALLFAVPVGLFAAIYLAEYASRSVRAIAKPAIEILAGIPTIVYGLFALVTVGPILRDYFAAPLGLGNSSSSVMTAGLVMGIMLIPFVSSLSDDVINAVPQTLRDGSYALGATKSETVKRVILPAALPGIVGSVLLATSRAIGETMIVVMGAGAAAKLNLNPFEAMTTITVKIVSQLTGDTEFASPETLVAFALGLSLFVMTLGLNVFALYVVRRYQEQYE